MEVIKARLLSLILLLSSSLFLPTLPFSFGGGNPSTEYDPECIARICREVAGIDVQYCKDKYAGYCEVASDYKKPMSELAQCQQRCEEKREPRERQQCQSRCLQHHQEYQQCMQICQGSGTTAARSPELCRKVCRQEQGGEYLSVWYSNPDRDKGKLYLKCMDRCKTSQEPQLCLRMCMQGEGEGEPTRKDSDQ